MLHNWCKSIAHNHTRAQHTIHPSSLASSGSRGTLPAALPPSVHSSIPKRVSDHSGTPPTQSDPSRSPGDPGPCARPASPLPRNPLREPLAHPRPEGCPPTASQILAAQARRPSHAALLPLAAPSRLVLQGRGAVRPPAGPSSPISAAAAVLTRLQPGLGDVAGSESVILSSFRNVSVGTVYSPSKPLFNPPPRKYNGKNRMFALCSCHDDSQSADLLNQLVKK